MNVYSKLVGIVLILVGGMWGQSISPPVAEYRASKIDGMFEISNNADYPMATILETKSFDVDDQGQVRYRALDAGIEIKLGASSFVLRAHDKRMVFYKATFPSAPASFSIITTMAKLGAVEGMRINFIFPHMIYVYQRDKLQPSDIKLQLADGVLHIQNLSQKLGRVESAEGTESGSFPLYPGQTREIAAKGATKVTVKFQDGFKVEAQ